MHAERERLPIGASPSTSRCTSAALCDDMVARLPELAHIDMSRVAVCFCQTRKPVPHGMYASLTPLRFAGGAATTRPPRPASSTIQRVCDRDGREMLYILSFYLPRFQNLDFREKLITVLHELWHISPRFQRRHPPPRRPLPRPHAFAGRIRRTDGPAGRPLAGLRGRRTSCGAFCDDDFRQLAARHGGIVGLKIRRPRIVPVVRAATAAVAHGSRPA